MPSSWRSALLPAVLYLSAVVALSSFVPLWLDEIVQLIETRQPSTLQLVSGLRRNSGAVPLGYLVQRASLQISGYSVRKARFPSALFGFLSIVAVGLLAGELGIKHGWLAATLFALLPEVLRYGAEARVYSQGMFFSALSVFLYLRLVRDPGFAHSLACFLCFTAAVYTQPYAITVAPAMLGWSLLQKDLRSAAYGALALGGSILAFLPWYLWSKAVWDTGIAREGFRFALGKSLVVIFREVSGAGYWGAGLLLLLSLLAARKAAAGPALRLLGLLIAVPVIGVLAADAAANYFVAARQFIWILPAAVLLAALAVEASPRMASGLVGLLALVCVFQSFRYFSTRQENWQAASDALAERVAQGACVAVVPSEYARYYEYFHPKLEAAACQGPRLTLAITPYTAAAQKQDALAALTIQGYRADPPLEVGKSLLFDLHKP